MLGGDIPAAGADHDPAAPRGHRGSGDVGPGGHHPARSHQGPGGLVAGPVVSSPTSDEIRGWPSSTPATRRTRSTSDGPVPYLVMAATTPRCGRARACSCRRLVDSDGGRLQLSDFQSSGDLHLAEGRRHRDRAWKLLVRPPQPRVGGTWRCRPFRPTPRWRPRWRRARASRADGVLALDVIGPASSRATTGPVHVGDLTVDARKSGSCPAPVLRWRSRPGGPSHQLAEIARRARGVRPERSPRPARPGPGAAGAAVEGRHLMLWVRGRHRAVAQGAGPAKWSGGDHDVLLVGHEPWRQQARPDQYQAIEGGCARPVAEARWSRAAR